MSREPKFHPVSVAAALKRAGFERSQYHASGQVRGWGNSTEGFRVIVQRVGYGNTSPVDCIEVLYRQRDTAGTKYDEAKQERQLTAMCKALTDAGYNAKRVTRGTGWSSTKLVEIRDRKPEKTA